MTSTSRRRRLSLRRQLLVVLIALSVPLLVVGPVGGILLRSTTADHVRSSERVRVAASVTDLQARVAALTSSLTERKLFQGDYEALLTLLRTTRSVEDGFASVRTLIPPDERVSVDRAYVEWTSLVGTLALLPPRFPILRSNVEQLSLALGDIGPRVLRVAQVLSVAGAKNAEALQAELDLAHARQRAWLGYLVGLALVGVLAAVVAARWLHRRITGPLVALQKAAQRFGADELEHRVREDRTPELGDLARAFNQMAGHLHHSRAQLSEREQRFRALVQNSSDVVAVIDINTVVTYVTPSVQRVLDHHAEQLHGTRLLELVHPDDRQLVTAVIDATALRADAGELVACRLRLGSGQPEQWRHTELVVHNLCDDAAVGGLVVTARDVTEQTRLHEQLRHSALHDELTGLANRALLTDRLDHALAVRGDSQPAVLYCDLDDFKAVNDSIGHAAGDLLLATVAERLTAGLRARDTAARFGGDEFVVLLEDMTVSQARETAERLLDTVGQSVRIDGVEVFPRMSIGVAVGPVGGCEELLRQADAAMYQAKNAAGRPGRQAVVVYDAELAAALLDRLELKSDLQRALQQDEFFLLYQPTVDLPTGEVTGVEALVRWNHPGRGTVSPIEFIPLSEESGLIVKLGLWVLETACAQARAWQLAFPHRPLHLNVNLSGRQLEYADIVDDVASVLALTGLAPNQLTLELTESVLLDRSDEVLARLHGLKALGLSLAIDDFGTGYSSLSYLQRLPIDVLKIDKSFVDSLVDVDAAGTADALAATIVNLARTLGLSSVAEGIEHSSQAAALLELGCDIGQGYLYARPLSVEALAEVLSADSLTDRPDVDPPVPPAPRGPLRPRAPRP